MAPGIKEELSDGEELGMKGEISEMEMLALRGNEQRKTLVDARHNDDHEHEMDTDSEEYDSDLESGDDLDEDYSEYEEKPKAKRPRPSHECQPAGKRLKTLTISDHTLKKPALGFGQSAHLGEDEDEDEEHIDDDGVQTKKASVSIKRLAKKAIKQRPSLEEDIEHQKTAFLSVIHEMRGKASYEKGGEWQVVGLKEKPSIVQLFCKQVELS
jgi:hypothetical protein